MSDLLRRQIEKSLLDIRSRDRHSLTAPLSILGKQSKEEYDKETLQMFRDCQRGLRWLENCEQ